MMLKRELRAIADMEPSQATPKGPLKGVSLLLVQEVLVEVELVGIGWILLLPLV
jgi:hypothetical protein